MNEDLEFKDIDEDDEEEVKIPEIHGTKNYMTRACYNRLLDERKNLVLVERPNDEADASVGDVSWISPIARVFLKHFEGDTVLLPTPKGVKKLEILEVTYVNDPPGKPHII